MIDFVWHNCKGKKGFQKYTYQKLSDELQEYVAHFPMMSTQELVKWAKTCHPNVSIHAYDSTWRKFMKHIPQHGHSEITLVFYIKDHHLYPIQDARLKQIATKANQGGAENLWRHITDMKWSEPEFVSFDEGGESQEPTNDVKDKPTFATIEDHAIILPPNTKVAPVIEEYVTRTNYFVEYLHFDNNGRLDCFLDHKNNMYVFKGPCSP